MRPRPRTPSGLPRPQNAVPRRRAGLALGLALALGGALAPPAAAEAPPARLESAVARELGELVGAVHAELALLGQPVPAAPEPAFVATDRLPPVRELCLFARELARKAERLARARGAASPVTELPPPEARPEVADLRALLERARAALAAARGAGPAPEPLHVRVETPGLALDALRRADGALGRLLLEPPSLGDLHLELTRGLAHASAIRARFPGRRLPLAPPLEEGSHLEDTWRALVECWARTQDLCAAAGLQRLSLAPPEEGVEVGPRRLALVTALLGDELELLYQLHGEPSQLAPTCHGGERSPAELRRRAEHLGRQLRDLRDLAVTRGALGPLEGAD